MQILVTGVAGFIGSHVALALLERGDEVTGIDNLNDYYNPAWKQENLSRLETFPQFLFQKIDFCNLLDLEPLFLDKDFDVVIHLGARAGVRPSIADPLLYEKTNVQGTLNILELARKHGVPRIVAASSSSVYGNQTKVPFSETDPANTPISPYASSKKSLEMYCHTYAHLYNLNITCLRFFTVYGPHGRPDMAPYLFTEAILKEKPIKKFGNGETKRDYTYINDIVTGVLGAIDYPQSFAIYNLGNNTPVSLNEFISTLEEITGKQAIIDQQPMQPGDVEVTYADISSAQKDLNYEPKTSLESGLQKFVEWYKTNRLS